jgi:hypothetical protein
MRSKMSTLASTAIPMERIRPAIPGQRERGVERREPAQHQDHVHDQRPDREHAGVR